MAKLLENGSLRMAILISGFAITIGTIVFGAGAIRRDVEVNSVNIRDHWENGCKPSMILRKDVAAIEADAKARQNQMDRIENKLDRLIENSN